MPKSEEDLKQWARTQAEDAGRRFKDLDGPGIQIIAEHIREAYVRGVEDCNERIKGIPPDISALTTQLTQMNERARWYAGQIWQIPLGYVAAIALVSNAAGKGVNLMRAAMIFLAMVGVAVVFQLMRIYEGNHRAVMNIGAVEEKLNLDRTARHVPWTTVTMIVLVALITLIFVIGSIWFADDLAVGTVNPGKM